MVYCVCAVQALCGVILDSLASARLNFQLKLWGIVRYQWHHLW
jgi:hypothetical protein